MAGRWEEPRKIEVNFMSVNSKSGVVSDPLHEIGGATTTWTTVNTRENFPGVATPLGWTFWRDPLERGMKGAFCDIGVLSPADVVVPVDVDNRFSAAIFGRFSANVDCLRRVADKMPGTSGDALEEQLLGSVRPDAPSARSVRRYPVVAFKMPRAVWALTTRIAALRQETDEWWRAIVRRPPRSLSDARRVLREASAQFELVMRPHSIVTLLGTGIFETVAKLAVESGNPGLEKTLVSGYGGLEEAQIAADLWKVSRGELDMEEFLRLHGYHGPLEAEISALSWREDPAPVRNLVVGYSKLPNSSSPTLRAQRQVSERQRAERELMTGLSTLRRLTARIVLKIARRYIPLREVGKAAFLQTLDAARVAIRFLGSELQLQGWIESADDVRFLTVDELLEGGDAELRVLVAVRKSRYREYSELTLPDVWVGEPETFADTTMAAGSGGTRDLDTVEVEGLPVSPGVVEGVAHVVLSGADNDIDSDEILVCPTTDPSWTSYFLIASAVVIDIGGPLSHGAIVAREMGIPCVINTGNGTKRIRTGDRIRVDGSTGRIQILEFVSESE
ncbi:hypothetical protein AXA44_45445 [Rhodococcus sp. SC4]|nr:hypothetical protein AXA44_45445 [Rhodococcus sp. SC4]